MGKYDGMRDRLKAQLGSEPVPEVVESVREPSQLELWDPFAPLDPGAVIRYEKREPLYMSDDRTESIRDRKLRMLRQLKNTCWACSMCDLGQRCASKDYMDRDPHCFSNMNPARVFLVGQNPGWEELAADRPFVGASGKNFDVELEKHGVTRDDFYICNAVRCWTEGNRAPSEKHLSRCEPFLHMEVNLIKPRLVATLGAVAFGRFCPDVRMSDSFGSIVRSEKFGVPVFPLYHPSPRNLDDDYRRGEFARQVELLCGLVLAIRKS